MLQTAEREEEMKAVVLKGQQFAYTYLHEAAKALYVRQAIMEYNKLFYVGTRYL
jgi:hypothetical protein